MEANGNDRLEQSIARSLEELKKELGGHFVEIRTRFEGIDRRFDEMGGRLDEMGGRLGAVESELQGFRADVRSVLSNHENRITALERRPSRG